MKRLIFIISILIPILLQTALAEEVLVGDYTAKPNSSLEIPVIAIDFSSIAGMDISIHFNSSIIEVSGYSINSSIKDCYAFEKIENGKGTARFLITCPRNITSPEMELLTLKVKAKGDIGERTELILSANLSTGEFKLKTAETHNGSLTIKAKSKSGGQGGFEGGGGVSSTPKTTKETQTPLTKPTEIPLSQATKTPTPNPVITPAPALTTTLTPTATATPTPTAFPTKPTPGFEAFLTVAVLVAYLVWKSKK